MTRREIMKAKAVLGIPALTPAQNPAPVFTLPKLPYVADALEPYIDARTMAIHHGKHHQTYVDNLNKALAGQAQLDCPHVTVDSPSAELKTTESSITVSGIVNDLVVGTVSSQQATVLVNRISAQVANRHYVAVSIPLSVGENTNRVVGLDQTGNSATV